MSSKKGGKRWIVQLGMNEEGGCSFQSYSKILKGEVQEKGRNIWFKNNSFLEVLTVRTEPSPFNQTQIWIVLIGPGSRWRKDD